MVTEIRDAFFWAQGLSTLPKVIITLVVILVCLLVLVVLWGSPSNKDLEKTGTVEPRPQGPPIAAGRAVEPPPSKAVSLDDQREFTSRTPRQLLTLYDGRTPLQADKLMEPYKGLWIQAQGVVFTILPDGVPGHSIGVLRSNNDTIECRFGPSWSHHLARVDKGDTISVVGKISSIQNGSQLYLLDCEVIS
jgi:hypothetical protein